MKPAANALTFIRKSRGYTLESRRRERDGGLIFVNKWGQVAKRKVYQLLLPAPGSPSLKLCGPLDTMDMQGLGWSWPECLLQRRFSFSWVSGFCCHSEFVRIMEAWLPLCTAVLHFFSYYHHRFNHKKERSLLFQIVSLNLKNQEIRLQSQKHKFNHNISVRENIRPCKPNKLILSLCSNILPHPTPSMTNSIYSLKPNWAASLE